MLMIEVCCYRFGDFVVVAVVERDATGLGLSERKAVSWLNSEKEWNGQVAPGRVFDRQVWFVAVAEADAIDRGLLGTAAEPQLMWIDQAVPGRMFDPQVWFVAAVEADVIDRGPLEMAVEPQLMWIDHADPGHVVVG
jgi:hypothetical protein